MNDPMCLTDFLEGRPFAGGWRNRVFDPNVVGPQHHEIIVSRPWLEEACRKGGGHPRVAGLECEDALDGLQRLIEAALADVGAHVLHEDPAHYAMEARRIANILFRHP